MMAMDKAKKIIHSVKGKTLTNEQRRESAIDLAAFMHNEARRIQHASEKKHQEQIARLMKDPLGKVFTTCVTDQCFRSSDTARVADQLTFLIKKIGVPNYFSWDRKIELHILRYLGKPLHRLFIPLTKSMIRAETSTVIVPGESSKINKHLEDRRKEGVRINLNHLGEAILGEEDAQKRLKVYLKDLEDPAIEYISVKISTICSQLNLLAEKQTLGILGERLKTLYRAAQNNLFDRGNGEKVKKFVNLDMEEYRDLHLTINLFKSVLDEQEFHHYSAGIVLQSYLPDSYLVQQDLTEWAMNRVSKGGAPIKIRIVKGANLAMEQVEASLRNWPQAPYTNKTSVDANFKRMLNYGCEPEHAKAALLGIGSHNLFDIAYALLLAAEKEVEPYVCFEMLEGMADPMRRVVQTLSNDMLLYCPVAAEEEFQYAVAYLVRRLDENTAPENFLRHAFSMVPGDQEWQHQAMLFSLACENIGKISSEPRRRQNRLTAQQIHDPCSPFENEPDTDWSLPDNRKWAEEILENWSRKVIDAIPLVIAGKQIDGKETPGVGNDPSHSGSTLYRYALADEKDIENALDAAKKAFNAWSLSSVEERSELMAEIAQCLRKHRGNLIGAMVADTGKTMPEADVEVSEAIDFAEYYRRNIEEVTSLQDIHWHPKGPVLVAPPWNFPCSIPAGGILAALAAGNSVIFKPAPEAILVGWQLADIFWEAGVSKEVLQFIACEDDPVGCKLIKDARLAAIILTGSTETAKLFMKLRPGIDLSAETGGKNTLIITGMSDRDLAVKDLIQSAFGHSGQKCSACSLAICEAEVYDNPEFLKTLRDAAASLSVGSAWDLKTRVNPLIRAPNSVLMRGLTVLEEGEEWLLKPIQSSINPNLWSPGIKLGVKAGSFTYQNELFGPVLGIMRADNLDHAIQLANGTLYGLTAGLHSLDEREQLHWIERIEAGNCYVNRGITGAIVQRQPFGGCKQSSYGRGAKAGGPNYVMQLMRGEQRGMPQEMENVNEGVHALSLHLEKEKFDPNQRALWIGSIGSYAFYWKHYFSKDHDPTKLVGQDNFMRYVPYKKVIVRIQDHDAIFDAWRLMAASATCGTLLEISATQGILDTLGKGEWQSKNLNVHLLQESEASLADRIFREGGVNHIRVLSAPSLELTKTLSESSCLVVQAPVLANGRVELLHFLREVSLSIDYHRYGNLGQREGEKRKPLPDAETKAKVCCEGNKVSCCC